MFRGTIGDIESQVSHLKGIAVILFGEFLHRKEKEMSALYNKLD